MRDRHRVERAIRVGRWGVKIDVDVEQGGIASGGEVPSEHAELDSALAADDQGPAAVSANLRASFHDPVEGRQRRLKVLGSAGVGLPAVAGHIAKVDQVQTGRVQPSRVQSGRDVDESVGPQRGWGLLLARSVGGGAARYAEERPAATFDRAIGSAGRRALGVHRVASSRRGVARSHRGSSPPDRRKPRQCRRRVS